MTHEEEVTEALDRLVKECSSGQIAPARLYELSTAISTYRYTLSEYVTGAEREALYWDHEYDRHIISGRILLQSADKKLPATKATDQVENSLECEQLFQKALQAKVHHKGLHYKLQTTSDILVSLAMRIKRNNEEAMEARYQQQPR